MARRPPLEVRMAKKGTCKPPVDPSVFLLCHPRPTTTNLSYRFPILETSATALRGTTGMYSISKRHITLHVMLPKVLFRKKFEIHCHITQEVFCTIATLAA